MWLAFMGHAQLFAATVARTITMPRCVAVKKTSWKRTMFGWRSHLWFTSSRSTFLRGMRLGISTRGFSSVAQTYANRLT